MKKSKLNGKNIYWNEKRLCWCYMNHRPIQTVSDMISEKVAPVEALSFSAKIVKFFKGE